jgi:sarcosine oxidase subunit alpha
MLARTTAFGVFAQNFVALAERVTDHVAAPDPASPRERLWQVRARQLVLATGAIERPMLFSGNDRPGIMLAGAARTYLHRYGVKPGSQIVLTTEHDAAYGVALDLARAGIRIAAIIDPRGEAPGPLAAASREAGLTIKLAKTIAATHGRLRIHSATVTSADSGTPETIGCDLLLMSGGYTPSVHLFSQSRGALRFDASVGAYMPEGDTDCVLVAGACRAIFSPEAAIADGIEAGIHAAARTGFATTKPAARAVVSASMPSHNAASAPHGGRAFVDFQNDVTAKDVRLAVREGFVSIEHVKRYTTTGMATDQGKTSNINALGLVADERGTDLAAVGLTTFRMPYTPVTFGTLAGAARADLFDPVRKTPLHGWAEQHGAVFEDVGLWKRTRYFPKTGESMSQAVARECRAVRAAAGIFDASTLGKIEVVGPDAAIFLERMYVNGFRKLASGRARYGVLLREDGFIQDDGVIGRLAPDRFHVTTTTGGAPRVLSVMEDYLQTEWPDLRVWLTSTTEQWAVIAIQGPNARDIIAPLIDGIELNIPADYGPAVWNSIWQAGTAFGLTPYGTETMHVLRAEKGYIIVGQETDGTATPDDVGLAWAINTSKGDFVGKRSLARAAMADPLRKQLVGLLPESPSAILEEGAQLVATSSGPLARQSIGHVTSSYFSTTLGRSIALAMVSGGRSRTDHALFVPMPNHPIKVRVVSPVFHDPQGERLNG